MSKYLQLKKDPEAFSVADARRGMIEHSRQGVICPCCQRLFKSYLRSVRGDIGCTIIWMYRFGKTEYPDERSPWINVIHNGPESLVKSRDYTKGEKWGLIESKENVDPDKKDSGVWRLTERGHDFVEGRIAVDSHMLFLVNDPIPLTAEQKNAFGVMPVYATECHKKGNEFSFASLMAM